MKNVVILQKQLTKGTYFLVDIFSRILTEVIINHEVLELIIVIGPLLWHLNHRDCTACG